MIHRAYFCDNTGADGSVRMFDLRHLEHSTIIYEDAQHHPLLRLCWNKQDPNYLATMAMDAMEVERPSLSETMANLTYADWLWANSLSFSCFEKYLFFSIQWWILSKAILFEGNEMKIK